MKRLSATLAASLLIACGGGGGSGGAVAQPNAMTPLPVSEPRCGDGAVQEYHKTIEVNGTIIRVEFHQEACDDGNTDGGDLCPADCDVIITVVSQP